MISPRSSLASASKSDAKSLVEELAELEGLSEDESKHMDIDDFGADTLLELFTSRISG